MVTKTNTKSKKKIIIVTLSVVGLLAIVPIQIHEEGCPASGIRIERHSLIFGQADDYFKVARSVEPVDNTLYHKAGCSAQRWYLLHII